MVNKGYVLSHFIDDIKSSIRVVMIPVWWFILPVLTRNMLLRALIQRILAGIAK